MGMPVVLELSEGADRIDIDSRPQLSEGETRSQSKAGGLGPSRGIRPGQLCDRVRGHTLQ